jgi:hypothetical protein
VNLEKIIEWGAIILVVILGARWLAGLFGTGDPVQSGPQIYQPYGGYYYGTGAIYMAPGMVGRIPVYQGRTWTGVGRRRGR